MAQPRRRTNPFLAALSLIVIGAAWLLFAPTAVGGQAAYVVINGNSMEPGMRRGDLAVLHQSNTYNVGEVVTYRHPEIGPVIHRIIGRDGQHFIFKGDNNNFIDPYRPGPDELIGRVWLFIPRAGALLIFLRQPPIFACLAALVLGTTLMATSSVPLRQRQRRAPAGTRGYERAVWLNAALTFALALGLCALGLAALAFSRSTTRVVEQSIPYTQRVRFNYGAPAPADLFNGGVAQSGDPIFRQLADSVSITTTYTLESAAPAEVSGTAQLRLIVGDGDGWQRTLTTGPELPFRGRTITLAGTIDLPTVAAALRTYEARTGMRQGIYQLSIAPVYTLHGVVGGAQLATAYAPRLTFAIDELRLRPLLEGSDQQLASEEAGTLTAQRQAPENLALWALRLDVLTARRLALAGVEIALVVGAVAGLLLARELRRDPLAAVRLRAGVQVVQAAEGGAWTRGAIALRAMDDLAQLAERSGQPVLQLAHGPERGYYLRDGELVYVYGAAAGPLSEEA